MTSSSLEAGAVVRARNTDENGAECVSGNVKHLYGCCVVKSHVIHLVLRACLPNGAAVTGAEAGKTESGVVRHLGWPAQLPPTGSCAAKDSVSVCVRFIRRFLDDIFIQLTVY